jgi:hypothetical protein
MGKKERRKKGKELRKTERGREIIRKGRKRKTSRILNIQLNR